MTASNAAECASLVSLELRNNKHGLGVVEGMVDIMSATNSKRTAKLISGMRSTEF